MDFLEPLRSYTALITVAHHVPGRIRLKLNADMADLHRMEASGIGKRFGNALDALPGIRGVHINRLAKSITVEYDNKAIPDQAWPDLLTNRNSPEAAVLLGRLQDQYRQTLKP